MKDSRSLLVAEEGVECRLTTILVADIVGYLPDGTSGSTMPDK